MADEPRVARLHLVPTSDDRAGGGTRVAEFGDLAAGDGDGGGGDAGETGDAAPGGVLADLGLIGRGAGPDRPARLAVVEQAGPGPVSTAPVRDGVDLGRISAAASPPVRVARLGPTAAGRSPSGGRQERRQSDLGPPEADPPGAGRSPHRRSRRPAARPRPDQDDTPPAAGPSREGEVVSARRDRRPPGPKQIDPDADPVAAAKDICLDLLTARARTKHELADALRRRGVPDEAAATALDRFDEVGLIDDAAFAGLWVRSRQRTKGLARRALAVELRRKGVDDEVAGEALAEVDAHAEELRARELVDRKLRTVPADTPEQRTSAARRLVGMLARKGYSGGIAYRVVREALAAHGADMDELGSAPAED